MQPCAEPLFRWNSINHIIMIHQKTKNKIFRWPRNISTKRLSCAELFINSYVNLILIYSWRSRFISLFTEIIEFV